MELKDYLLSEKEKKASCLSDLEKKMDELKELNEKSEDEKELKDIGDSLEELEAEKAELVAELKEVEAQIDALDQKEEKPKEEGEGEEIIIKPQRKAFLNYEVRTNGGKENMNLEERMANAEKVKQTGRKVLNAQETRAVLVSGGSIATPTKVEGIVDTFNRVSSIVDLVKVENCDKMGSNKVAYEVNIGTAVNRTEGQAIGGTEPTYNFVTITPTLVGTLAYLSYDVIHQSPLDYEGKIVDSTEKALRVKAAALITSKIVASDLIAKPASLKIEAVDEKTLRNIAFNYGSEEAIYGDAWLFLNKKDLIAFGDVRSTTTLEAVYEITPDTSNPNTGVIKDGGLSVRYCLNPNCVALADASENDVTMFYGIPSECAELDLFGDYDVRVSEDYAFDKNLLTIRGTAQLGADVIKKDGFVAVTKGA